MRRLDQKRTSTRRLPLAVEGLEERQLLSAARVAHDTILKARTVATALADQHAKPLVDRVVSTAKDTARLLKTSTKKLGDSTPHVTPKIVPIRSPLLSDYIIYPGMPGRSKKIGQITSFSPPSSAYTPSQISTAYGLNLLPTTNQGQGVTIGIVDELVDPTIASDVAAFSTQFNLPQLDGLNGDGTFTTIEDTAFGTPGTSEPGGTSLESALDVEWAHAMAPKANIVLVFVPATGSLDNEFNEILHGVQLAASQPGVVAVSTSYGYFTGTVVGGGGVHYNGFTTAQETALNNTYLNTGAATNVALTFSAGDYSLPEFPAVSPNVIAVGGTSLYTATARGRYAYELPWGGIYEDGAGGGGISTAFGLPSFQSSAGLTYAGRAIPDISMDADPITGVPVYSANDASTNGGDPWFQIGGTSLSSPPLRRGHRPGPAGPDRRLLADSQLGRGQRLALRCLCERLFDLFPRYRFRKQQRHPRIPLRRNRHHRLQRHDRLRPGHRHRQPDRQRDREPAVVICTDRSA